MLLVSGLRVTLKGFLLLCRQLAPSSADKCSGSIWLTSSWDINTPLIMYFLGGAYRQEISFFVTFLGGGGMGAVVDVGVSGDSCCFWLQKASRDIRNINWLSPFRESSRVLAKSSGSLGIYCLRSSSPTVYHWDSAPPDSRSWDRLWLLANSPKQRGGNCSLPSRNCITHASHHCSKLTYTVHQTCQHIQYTYCI